MSIDDLVLGFGIYILVYALLFLLFLPFNAARHKEGENIAPQLIRMSLWLFPASLIATVLLMFLL